MKEHIEVITKEPIVKKLFIFDDVIEYLEWYCTQDSPRFEKGFTRVGYNDWVSRTIKNDNNTYYSFDSYDDVLLTKKAYDELLNMCTKKYSIRENDLVRTQNNSNCRYTGDLHSADIVIEYMHDAERSWLPNIYDEIDKEIGKLNNKISDLQGQKKLLQDDNYLRSKIKVDYQLKYAKSVVE